ncbi:E3 ubiquitin-protein ligase E3D [Petromyzon marinus]|nr:E3 ubiquitin-protein ligase E3D isoform X2 [Petromyzon marinus]XP_032829322.1 E3 ubiquitin-protein ligase E3D isoform X2 [Petromyzon marinus]XP_032829323.1 E3 ubiquitin-protein ligase E3D isoform X2 [Petromyzon marinus]XP_032829324.1 E3 ubiquitin-protein ligase E3D isoform X2 [Petromyzon marinus]
MGEAATTLEATATRLETRTDEEADELPGFYCEIRSGSRTAHLVLRDVRTEGPVLVEASRVTVRAGARDLLVTLPPGVTADPGATGSVRRVPEDGTHVSLRLHAPRSLFAAVSNARPVVQQIREQPTPRFSCQACGASLLRPGAPFRRVLPLPSCHWQAMVSEWCCHGGGARVDSLARTPLGPRASDCLVGDTHLVLHAGSLGTAVRWHHDVASEVAAPDSDRGARPAAPPESGDLCRHRRAGASPGTAVPQRGATGAGGAGEGEGRHAEGRRSPSPPPPPPPLGKAKAELRCEQCGRVLGEALGAEAVKLFLTEVCVGGVEETAPPPPPPHSANPRSWFLERLLSQQLLLISTTLCSYRFRVEDPRGGTRLLLWVLNSDTLLLQRPRGGGGGEAAAPRCHRVLKLLYRHAGGDSATSASREDELWARDVKAHDLCLPSGACTELSAVLSASSQLAPPSLRDVNHFRVGHLRLA